MKRNQNKKRQTVVVFGGSGFLGSHVADVLSDQGYHVTIFDSRPSKYVGGNQKMIVGDILDSKKVESAVAGCKYVYNFAGIANLDNAATQPMITAELNIIGNLNILNASIKARVIRFVYASTIYVYSDKGGFYRCSKQASELYIEEFQRRYGLDFTILRYGTLYGPRADEQNSIYKYLKQAMSTGRITCSARTEGVRDYVHVRDAAKLSVKILEPDFNNKHIIISGLHPIKFKEMILIIEEILGKKLKVEITQEQSPAHYDYTPYSFIPKIGEKLTSNIYTDMGQGLLESMHAIKQCA